MFTTLIRCVGAPCLASALFGCSSEPSGEVAASAPWAPAPALSCRYILVENSVGSVGGYSSNSTEYKPMCEAQPCREVKAPSTTGGYGVYTSSSVSKEIDLIGPCASGTPASCSDRTGSSACETAALANCCRSLLIAEQDPNETRILECVAKCPDADAACPKACTSGAPAASVENLTTLVSCMQAQQACTSK